METGSRNMLLDYEGFGGKPRRVWPPKGMWSPEEYPHASMRKSAKPQPCTKACTDIAFVDGEGCSYCDYNPFKDKK